MQCTFSIQQRLAEPGNLTLTRDLLRDTPGLTRAQLTRELCRQMDLRDPKGDWQIGTTAKALRDLEAQGLCQLPLPTAVLPAWPRVGSSFRFGGTAAGVAGQPPPGP
jgi:hypothetical protein